MSDQKQLERQSTSARDPKLTRREVLKKMVVGSAVGALMLSCSSDSKSGVDAIVQQDTSNKIVDTDTPTFDLYSADNAAPDLNMTPDLNTTPNPDTTPDSFVKPDLVAEKDTFQTPDSNVKPDLVAEADSTETCSTKPGCSVTDSNIEGPFYRPDTPSTIQIAPLNDKGDQMTISGTVFADDCVTPLKNAKVEVWQADADGKYDNSHTTPAPGEFKYRGTMLTDNCGRYSYHTIMPGRYLNGAQFRPSHIHYKVSHNSGIQLTTQLYFKGDPYNGIDPFILPDLIIPLEEKLVEGTKRKLGVFDIVLKKA